MIRTVRFLSVLAIFMIKSTFIKIFNSDKAERYRKLSIGMHRSAIKMAKVYNVSIRVEGRENLTHGAALLLANHMSYVDIVVMSAVCPTLFLSHTGVQQTPFLGKLAESGGSIFIDKSAKNTINNELAKLAKYMIDGSKMTLFPEGTTFAGDGVHAFHSTFIEAAVLAKVPVIPICIQYETVNNVKITHQNRDIIMVHTHQNMVNHLKILYKTVKSAEVTVHILPPIDSTEHKRKVICEKARDSIVAVFKPVEEA